MVSSGNKSLRKQSKEAVIRPTRRQLRERTLALLAREIDFIDNDEFTDLDDKAMITGGKALLRRIDAPTVSSSNQNVAPPINNICAFPLLQKDDERELFRAMNYFRFRANALKAGLDPKRPSIRKIREIDSCLAVADKLCGCAVKANTRLVVSIVKKFVNQHSDFEELFSEGLACLLRVVGKFDYGRGFRFSTYATWALKNWMIRVRERSQRQADRFKTGLENISWEESRTEEDLQVDAASDREKSEILKTAMGVLNDRERLIIESRCGFRTLETAPTLKNLGEMLGVCKERIRQIERKGMDKIREQLEEMNVSFDLAADY